jgi:hypothetical protein
VLTASTVRLCLDWPVADSNRHWARQVSAPARLQAGQRPTLPPGGRLRTHLGSGAALRGLTAPQRKRPPLSRGPSIFLQGTDLRVRWTRRWCCLLPGSHRLS